MLRIVITAGSSYGCQLQDRLPGSNLTPGSRLVEVSTVKRLQNHYYHQRILVLLTPLLLLALITWWAEARNSPYLGPALRPEILACTRLAVPALLTVLITCLVPVANRGYQILITLLAYIMLITLTGLYGGDLLYPTIPALAATTSVFALLKKSGRVIRHPLLKTLTHSFFALALPLLCSFIIVTVMEQIMLFIHCSFRGEFAHSDLTAIYVPLYFLLQAFGYHGVLADIAAVQYTPERAVAFGNAILMTMLFVLPTAIFVRSLFTQGTLRITLTFLGICTILTSSIGTCASLVLVFMLIFFPGAFIIIALSAVCLFFISVNLEVPQLVAGDNLYRPDINLSFLDILYSVPQSKFLVLAAIAIPLITIPAVLFIRLDKTRMRHTRQALSHFSAGPDLRRSPDLQVVALLRAVGGISNLQQIALNDNILQVQVYDTELVAPSLLSQVCISKVGSDRAHKQYNCALGDNAPLIAHRLDMLCDNSAGHPGYEITPAQPYAIPARYFAAEP